MGNQPAITQKQKPEAYQQLIDNTTPLGKYASTFGSGDVLRDNFDPKKYYFEITLPMKASVDADTFARELEFREKHSYPCLAQIHAHKQVLNSQCFADAHKVTFVMDYAILTLYDAIKDRVDKLDGQLLPEEQAWFVFDKLATGGKTLEDYKFFSGDLSPKTVLCFDNAGTSDLKIVEMSMVTPWRTSVERHREDSSYKAIFAPEQLENIRRGEFAELKVPIADVFAAGMTVLCTTFAENFEEFYNYTTYELANDKIFKRILKLKSEGYSDQFTDILVRCLTINPNERITFNELYTTIQDYLFPDRQRGPSVLIQNARRN